MDLKVTFRSWTLGLSQAAHTRIRESQKPQPLELRFRALLTEGSADEQVELARA